MFKWDLTNEDDLKSEFDIGKSLNDNWGKIDTAIEDLDTRVSSLESISKYRLEVKEPIVAKSELTLDFQYVVGRLEVYYCGQRMIKGTVDGTEEDGEYAEVGEEGTVSNKIIVGFDVPVSLVFPRYFDFVVKGEVGNA